MGDRGSSHGAVSGSDLRSCSHVVGGFEFFLVGYVGWLVGFFFLFSAMTRACKFASLPLGSSEPAHLMLKPGSGAETAFHRATACAAAPVC